MYVYVYVGVRLSSPPQNLLPPGSERGIFLGAEADLGWPGKGRIYLFIYLFIHFAPGFGSVNSSFFFFFSQVKAACPEQSRIIIIFIFFGRAVAPLSTIYIAIFYYC